MKCFSISILTFFILLLFFDNIFSQNETKIIASDGALADWYGMDVVISDDGLRAVVGAWQDDDNGEDSGSIYVYDWDGSAWIETKITASDGSPDDNFGNSVAIDGDFIVVGAISGDGITSRTGVVYVYNWNGSFWNETKLEASDGYSFDAFGQSVAIFNDRIVIGAHNDDNNGNGSGSIYLYEWDGSNWVENIITASDGSSFDSFGRSVAILNNRIIVGASGDGVGSAYIYDWNGSSWIETKLVPSDGISDGFFGYSVAIDIDRIVVSSWNDDDNGTYSGSAYIFDWDGTSWIETKILPSDGSSGDRFGEFVALGGNNLLVGARFDADNGTASGSSYLFNWNGASWVETKILPSDGYQGDYFGCSGDLSSSMFIVGAREDDDNGPSSGSVYLYENSCSDIYEPNNTIANADVTAFPLFNINDGDMDTIISGNIHEIGDDDYYQIDIQGDGVIEVKLSNLSVNCQLIFFDDSGSILQSTQNTGILDEVISYTIDPINNSTNTYYIKVEPVGNSVDCTLYNLEVKFVRPLIRTNWFQEGVYNDDTPLWLGQESLAGCGPIALSQVCWYYEWPQTGQGSNFYKIRGPGPLGVPVFHDVDVDFSHQYNYISQQDKSKLVYEVGAACNSIFNLRYTGTFEEGMKRGMMQFLRYQNPTIWDTNDNSPYDNKTTYQIFQKIIENLSNNKPVIVFGSSNDINNSARHVMIIDGISADLQEVHINYGWNLICHNKYYNILDLECGLECGSTCPQFFRDPVFFFDIYPNDPNGYQFPDFNSQDYMIAPLKQVMTCPNLLLPEPLEVYNNNDLNLIWEVVDDAVSYLVTVKALGSNITYYQDEATYAGTSSFFEADLLPADDSIEVTIKPVDINGTILSCSSHKFYTSTYECNLIINEVGPVCASALDYEVEVDFSGSANNLYNIILHDGTGVISTINNVGPGTHTIGAVPIGDSGFITVEDTNNSECNELDMIVSPQCITCTPIDIYIDTVSCSGAFVDITVDLHLTGGSLVDLRTNLHGINEFTGVSSGLYTFKDIPYGSNINIIAADVIYPYDCYEIISFGNVDCGVCNVDCEIKITSPNPLSGESFGGSISSHENNVLIGAHNGGVSELGRVLLYNMDSCGYTPLILQSSDITIGDAFGISVDIYDDRLIVGSSSNDVVGDGAGALYIFDWDGTSWIDTKITASDAMPNDRFGWSCALEGDMFVVGAPLEDNSNGNNAGSIYIYEWDGSVWNETKLISSDGTTGLSYGSEVEILNGKVYVSAPGGQGSVYIYEWDGTLWSETKLTASDATGGDNFGTGLAVDSNRILVGARGDDDNGNLSGSAYVFDLIGNTWVETKILPSDGQQGDEFGRQVDLLSDKLVIGAAFDDDYGNLSGSVYLFEWNGATWDESKFYSSDIAAGDRFGTKVHIDSNYIYVNARFSPAGAVYLYDQNPDLYYVDNDSDGYGHKTLSISACFQPEGYVDNNLDCNDNNPNINPLISEVCDGIDNNCDGLFDEGNICCDNGLLINNYVGSSDNWFDASNWSLNVVPNICHRVIIPNGKTVRILQGQSGFCYTVKVKSGGLLDVKNGAVLQAVAPNN